MAETVSATMSVLETDASQSPQQDRNRAAAHLHARVDGLRLLEDITIRSVFAMDGQQHVDNSTGEAIEPWLQALAAIWPRAVQVCTLEGPVASPVLENVPQSRLKQIASEVRRLGIDAEAFG